MGQQWEYCQLMLKYKIPLSREAPPELLATFCGASGMVNYTMSTISWLGMFGTLGAAEWELVSATSVVNTDEATQYSAYFKRPVQLGRAADDVMQNHGSEALGNR
ncbi:MAG: hypothetical protein IVW57_12500 [Ktedonobacterales bacterium]|nr:hypothetical protein [Ktedonobacterales bacterium]